MEKSFSFIIDYTSIDHFDIEYILQLRIDNQKKTFPPVTIISCLCCCYRRVIAMKVIELKSCVFPIKNSVTRIRRHDITRMKITVKV